MNISYNWLRALINFDLTADETAEALTRVGLAVEGIHPHDDDLVFDIDLTSNRPDCLSHLGIAREIQVIADSTLATNDRSGKETIPLPDLLADDIVKIENLEVCHRFTARIIKNIKVGPSPKWLAKRLAAVGERSINNIADITNYVMLELGQPMHAFDLDKLAENRIIVRTAKVGETIKTLDEIERKLDDSMLAICDAEKPVAVAGVMGGFDSGISESTTNVLLEVAYFKRDSIRQTSRKLGLTTEASYRFERGVDVQSLMTASNRAVDLICEIAGGEAEKMIDLYPTPHRPKYITVADISERTQRLTGLRVDRFECVRILDRLGISQSDDTSSAAGEGISFSVPSWRHDLAIEEDLVEEIARHAGYENIAVKLPPARSAGEYQVNELRKRQIRRTLASLGFDEAITYSFIDKKYDEVFALVPGLIVAESSSQFVELHDSVIDGAVRMRPTIIPGLLNSLRLNFNHQRRNLKLFETGKAYAGTKKGELPLERELLTLVATGSELNQNIALPLRELDLYDIKGALEAVLDTIATKEYSFQEDVITHLKNGQAASIFVDGQVVGYIGCLDQEISANYKFKQPVFVAELNLDKVLELPIRESAFSPLAKYPSIVRDVSFLADRSVTFDQIRSSVLAQNVELFRDVSFVDVYQGKGLSSNVRSITIRLEYRSDTKTLVESDVEPVHIEIVSHVIERLGISQRI